MDNKVRPRISHYDALGLSADAGEGEIAQAFARKMSPFEAHAPGEAARICAAYETLRNPAKRRDYDRSLGLARPEPRQWTFAVSQQRWPGFVASTAAGAVDATPRAAEPQVAAAQPETRPELERASAIAASLRRLAEPAPFDGADFEPSEAQAVADRAPIQGPSFPPAPAEVHKAPEIDIYQMLRERAAGARLADDEDHPFPWKRPALAVGGLVLAAGLVGGVAGLSVKDDARLRRKSAPAVTVALPAAQPAAEAPALPVAATVEMAAEHSARADGSPPPTKRAEASSRFAQQMETKPRPSDVTGQSQPLEIAAGDLAAQPEVAEPIAASMPLPDAVVARTIERIGYSCGKVASTAAVEGASGVFKVTCSSGQTYQATPVHGRYRFRRAAAH